MSAERNAPAKFVLLALTALGAIGIVAYLVQMPGLSKAPRAGIQCTSTGDLSPGIECTLHHQSGEAQLELCWEINVTCANATRGTVESCGVVQPRSKTTVTVPYGAFAGALDRCDRATNASVTNVRRK